MRAVARVVWPTSSPEKYGFRGLGTMPIKKQSDCVSRLRCMHCESYDDDGYTTQKGAGGSKQVDRKSHSRQEGKSNKLEKVQI